MKLIGWPFLETFGAATAESNKLEGVGVVETVGVSVGVNVGVTVFVVTLVGDIVGVKVGVDVGVIISGASTNCALLACPSIPEAGISSTASIFVFAETLIE